ncbi:MAG: PTS sugar transporter subunit IIA [Rhodospirillales bacterium]|nr:PTS sugar transporter subunit IIA [Rhodospirillales bacterium]
MQLGSFLAPSAILPRLTVNSTRQLLHTLAKVGARETGLGERAIFQALMAREQRGSTGFGHGVALPHARLKGLARATGVFARLMPPIDFDAPDGRPVELVFCLLSPEQNNALHLAALATISRRLGRASLRRVLRGANEADAIHALLTDLEHTQPEAA